MERVCFSCERPNAEDQLFCGNCGSPLALSSFVSRQVDARLAESTRDREIVEKESAIRIFERAFGWAKLVAGIAGALLAVLAVGATWRFYDLRTAVDQAQAEVGQTRSSAEKAITETASQTSAEISAKSVQSIKLIQEASTSAIESGARAQATAARQGKMIRQQAAGIRTELRSQSAEVTKDVASARQQIEAANQLQPQMQSLQQQLSTAQTQIQQQQRVLASSEDFAKQIFSSHRQIVADIKSAPQGSYAETEAPTHKLSLLYVLIPDTPIPGTIQVQFGQTVAAPNSFLNVHNLLVLFLQQPAKDTLLANTISISYFPDPSDHDRVHLLSVKEGRVYADGEPLPRFGEPDPDFKSSKWFPQAPTLNFEH